ncbi:hypothetical protein CMK17_21930 [Candidatus Poribacteria bacterium]|jgi:hypothetical protein|nr:hypothetical protein [Candidatus Poribacteria bacterium]|tara:strand:+ start:375 stop:569 length:195 start_codon:yes stop_codon:yes gene_type:complete
MQMITNGSKKITREEIQKALKEYLNKGGQIKVLPSQKVYVSQYIGAEKYQSYENVHNLLYSICG